MRSRFFRLGVTFSAPGAQYRVSRLVIGRRMEPGFPPYPRLVHTARAGHVPPVPPAPRILPATRPAARAVRSPASHQCTTTLSPVRTCANTSAIAASSRTFTQPCEEPAYPRAAKSDE